MNANRKEPALELLIQTDPDKTVSLNSNFGCVRMIPFTGTADGQLFHGVIAPGAVDTQITNPVQVRHMSARYMLTGTDFTGHPCHIFIQNEGWFSDDAHPKPWRSVPSFLTDSEALASILAERRFVGEGVRDEIGLHIRFYAIEAGINGLR